jgi:O-antigen/teichoic acid export membrane protein
MSVVRRIAKNAGILFISNIVSKIFGFVYTVYMARYLGAEGFGIISFALAFTGMFSVIADLGLQPLTIREIARNKELTGKYLGNIAVIKFILGIITFLLIVLTINLMNYPKETVYVVYLIAFYVLVNSFNNMFYSIYQGHEKMEYVGIGNILNSSLMLLGVFIGMFLRFDVKGFAYIYLIAGIGVLVYNLVVISWKFVKPRIEIDLKFWKNLLKEAWPFALSGIFVSIYFWVDSIMLSYMKGNEVVGIYNAAYKLVYVLLFIPSIYFTTVYPILSRMYLESKDNLKFMYERSLKYFAVIGIFIGVATVLFAKYIILLIYGESYILSIPALKILIWAVVFSFMAHATLYTLNSINRQIIYTKVTALGAALNFVLNIFAIQKLSYIGASLTTVITEALGFFMMFLYLKYYLKEKMTEYLWCFRLIFAIMVSVIVYCLMLNVIKNFVLLFVSYGLVFFIGILVFKVVDDIDFKLISKILKR